MQDPQDWRSEPALLREMLARVLWVVVITYTINRKHQKNRRNLKKKVVRVLKSVSIG